jgi:hypothetical protein
MVKKVGYWKTHPDKELQALLVELHIAGWIIIDPKKYYRVLCGCPEKHQTTIHITPNRNYYKNKRRFLRGTTCFKNLGGLP